MINEIIVPCGLPPVAYDQCLDTRHPAKCLDEMRVLTGSIDDRLFVRRPVQAISDSAGDRIEYHYANSKHCQNWLVQPHHDDEPKGHQPIDQSRDRASCQCLLYHIQ